MKHLFFFLIGILSLSQAANLVRAAEVHPFVVGFWRLLSASIIMVLVRIWIATQRKEAFWQKVPNDVAISTAISGVFFFLHLWTFFIAAQNTKIANCMVIFSINPIFTALGAKFFLKDKFERRHAYGFALAFSGVVILFSDRLSFDSARQGDFAALLSGLFFSGYILSGKKSRLKMETEQFTWIIYLITAVLFFLAGELNSTVWTGYPFNSWLAIAATVLFPTLLGHVLITHLLKYFNINWLSCGKLFEPILSAIVAYYVFSENLPARTALAFLFTSGAVVALIYPLLKKSGDLS